MAKLFRGAILGAPASGKGTISGRIVKKFDVIHLSTGDILRQKISDETEEGKFIKKCMVSGKLLPDAFIMKVVMSKLKEVENKNWLFDGFPRTVTQAEELYKDHPLDLAINLKVPFDVIVYRTKGRWVHIPSGRVYHEDFSPPKIKWKDDETGEPLVQRADDKAEAVLERLNIYAKTVRPLVEFYSSKGILREFYGKTSDELWPLVEKCLSEMLEPKKS